MSVSTPLPPVGLMQALARMPGQTVEARVVGPQPDGTTQVQIGRQMVNLQLPSVHPPGSSLTLSAQQVDGQLKLSLVSALPPTGISVSATAAEGARPVPPAATVQLSPLAENLNRAAPFTSAGGAPTPPPVTSSISTIVSPPIQVAPSYAPAIANGVQVQAGARPDAPPPAQPVAVAVPPVVRGAVPYVSSSTPFVGAVPQGGATGTGERPPQGMAQGAGQQFAQSAVAGAAARGGIGQVGGSVAAPQLGQPGSVTQAAVTQMINQSIPKQGSVVALTTALVAIAGKVPLPPDVVKAAQGVLAQRVGLDGNKVDAKILQSAIRQSGVFHEALVGGGKGSAAAGDLKSALLGLQRQLGAWLGGDGGTVEAVSQLAPPIKGMQPRAKQMLMGMEKLPADPVEVGKILLERTEASLARVRLHQAASLPEPQVARAETVMSFDLPVQIAGQQTLLQMQIQGEPEAEGERPEDRGWQVRFAIYLAERGEVGAQIALRGKRTSVLIWCEDEGTGALLQSGLEQLQGELEGVGLMPGTVVVRVGVPAAPERPKRTHVVDETL